MTDMEDKAALFWQTADDESAVSWRRIAAWCFGAYMVTNDSNWFFLNQIAYERMAHQ